MDKYEKVFELLESTGLNWTVNKVPLFSDDGKPTGSFGMFRNDNNKWLGTVSEAYEPMQNHELADLVVTATGSEAIGDAIGSFVGGAIDSGKKTYIQMELPSVRIGNSVVRRYITALNSHDGSRSISFGATNRVMTCGNMFHRMYSDSAMRRYRHSQSASDKIREAISTMGQAAKLEKDVIKVLEASADRRPTARSMQDFLLRVYEHGLGIKDMDKPMTPAQNKIVDELHQCIETEISIHGRTAWALFNGATRYANYHVNSPDIEKSLLLGKSYRINSAAYEALESFA